MYVEMQYNHYMNFLGKQLSIFVKIETKPQDKIIKIGQLYFLNDLCYMIN